MLRVGNHFDTKLLLKYSETSLTETPRDHKKNISSYPLFEVCGVATFYYPDDAEEYEFASQQPESGILRLVFQSQLPTPETRILH